MSPHVIPNRPRQEVTPLEPSTGHGEWRLAHQRPQRGSEAPAARWPEELLTQFSLRMARHGMSISRTQMGSDSAYGQQQILHARELDDVFLHRLADRLAESAAIQWVDTPVSSHRFPHWSQVHIAY